MSHVVIYGFDGTYSGNGEYEYSFPEKGDTHKCMLFLHQKEAELNFDFAIAEINKFGFDQLVNLRGNLLKVEVLNTDSFKGFVGFYEEALEKGSSIIYYPNT